MFEFTLGKPMEMPKSLSKEKWKAEPQRKKGGGYLKQKQLDVTLDKERIE